MDHTSPGDRVFRTYELVSAILDDLQANDLLRLQRLNSIARDVILAEPQLRTTLFLDATSCYKPRSHRCAYGLRARWMPDSSRCRAINIFRGVPKLTAHKRTNKGDPDYVLAFSNKSQALAVLLKDRIRYSWEKMHLTLPAQDLSFDVKYLAEEDVGIAEDEQEHSWTWVAEKKATFHLKAPTLGDIFKHAAKIVVEDEAAWDPLVETNNSTTMPQVSASTYLKHFQMPVDENAEPALDFLSKHQLTFFSHAKISEVLVPTWPQLDPTLSSLSTIESEWLLHSDDKPAGRIHPLYRFEGARH